MVEVADGGWRYSGVIIWRHSQPLVESVDRLIKGRTSGALPPRNYAGLGGRISLSVLKSDG